VSKIVWKIFCINTCLGTWITLHFISIFLALDGDVFHSNFIWTTLEVEPYNFPRILLQETEMATPYDMYLVTDFLISWCSLTSWSNLSINYSSVLTVMHTVDVLMGRAFSWFIFVKVTYKSLSFYKQNNNDYGRNISFNIIVWWWIMNERHTAHSGWVKVRTSLCLIKQIIKMCGNWKYSSTHTRHKYSSTLICLKTHTHHTYLTSALERSELSAAHPKPL
jgi:hypothetical protein